mgnify:CR=1 FL=1
MIHSLGIKTTIPHAKEAIIDQDLVVHSAIIGPDNPEIIEAKEKGIEVLARREALLKILDDKQVYSVAGAHGKSTTTAILASIMEGSAIIGAESKSFGSNVRYDAKSDVMIFEADESDGSFINSNPYCAIVINAEPEHMEYYDYNYDRFYDSYKTFINSATHRILNAEDPFLATLVGKIEADWVYPSKDITDLEELTQRLDFAVGSTTDGLWDWNINANTIYFSPQWKREVKDVFQSPVISSRVLLSRFVISSSVEKQMKPEHSIRDSSPFTEMNLLSRIQHLLNT